MSSFKKINAVTSAPISDDVSVAQIVSKISHMLSTVDTLQHLVVAPSPNGPSEYQWYFLFKEPKPLDILQATLFKFFSSVDCQKGSAQFAARLLRTRFCIERNTSDGDNEHIQATLEGKLPISKLNDTIVDYPANAKIIGRASQGLTAMKCLCCRQIHNTICLTCVKPVMCGATTRDQKKFKQWAENSYICIGCCQTVCATCAGLCIHDCIPNPEVGESLHFKVKTSKGFHTFKENPFEIDNPHLFLKQHLPFSGVYGLKLKQIRMSLGSMTSYKRFVYECANILKEPGHWTMGIDHTTENTVFVGVFGTDKDFIKCSDVIKLRFDDTASTKYNTSLQELIKKKKHFEVQSGV